MARISYNTILYQKDKEEPHIAYIILNRPDKTNAISIGPAEMTGEIIDAVNRAGDDDKVKVVIFKGSGDNFSAGFDLATVYRVYGGSPGVRPQQARRLQTDNDHVVGMGLLQEEHHWHKHENEDELSHVIEGEIVI